MLTEAQKKQLGRMPLNKLINYIQNGHVTFPDDFIYVSDDKKLLVKEQLDRMPDSAEIAEWEALEAIPDSSAESLSISLEDYINRWGNHPNAQDHVNEARKRLSGLREAKRRAGEEKERSEWENLDTFSISALMNYLRRYPNTVHKDEIDDSVWTLAKAKATATGDVQPISEYQEEFDPDGRHLDEAEDLVDEYVTWKDIQNSRDLNSVHTFISENPDSVFISKARILLAQLKDEEIKKMRSGQSAYPVDTLLGYLREGIFSRNELINEDIVTNESLKILIELDDIKDSLPIIEDEIARCRKECAEGRTDVYLFGIPGTGKSCILMGLIGYHGMDVSYVRGGGPYAAALQQYLDAGLTIRQTPADFVATLEADIPNGNQTHRINLVEMAGEDFAFKLAGNPDGLVSFADMGEGAPALLKNSNRKAFFIIVDPTTRMVKFNRIVTRTDADGNEYKDLIKARIDQKTTLKKMVDLFSQPENSEIMRRVDSIHLIVSKADTLGEGADRDTKAYDLIMREYGNILRPLSDLCEKYGINEATHGVPKLYTFSLGKFYVGGIYQYEDPDAEKLVRAITYNVWGEKKTRMMDRIRNIFNKPRF